MEPFSAKTQDEFIYLSFEKYRKKAVREYNSYIDNYYYPSRYTGAPEIIRWLYKLGRDLKLLSRSYEEFERILKNEHSCFHNGKMRTGWRYSSWRGGYFTPENYRRPRRFRQKDRRYKKKARNQRQKDWWEKKGYERDRKRATQREKWWNSAKRNLKHFGARKHRRKERQALIAERFDLLSKNSYKEAEDIWSWD
jgi:hypothetical protein